MKLAQDEVSIIKLYRIVKAVINREERKVEH